MNVTKENVPLFIDVYCISSFFPYFSFRCSIRSIVFIFYLDLIITSAFDVVCFLLWFSFRKFGIANCYFISVFIDSFISLNCSINILYVSSVIFSHPYNLNSNYKILFAYFCMFSFIYSASFSTKSLI